MQNFEIVQGTNPNTSTWNLKPKLYSSPKKFEARKEGGKLPMVSSKALAFDKGTLILDHRVISSPLFSIEILY